MLTIGWMYNIYIYSIYKSTCYEDQPPSVSKYTIPRIRSVLQLVYQALDQAGLVSELPCAHTQTWEFQSIPQTQTLKTAANRYFSANLGKDTIHGAIGN